MYSRMADKLSKGSNSSIFKTVSTDIGVIGMQGKALKYEKLQYWQQTTTTKKTTTTNKQTKTKKKKKKKKKKNDGLITFKKKI